MRWDSAWVASSSDGGSFADGSGNDARAACASSRSGAFPLERAARCARRAHSRRGCFEDCKERAIAPEGGGGGPIGPPPHQPDHRSLTSGPQRPELQGGEKDEVGRRATTSSGPSGRASRVKVRSAFPGRSRAAAARPTRPAARTAAMSRSTARMGRGRRHQRQQRRGHRQPRRAPRCFSTNNRHHGSILDVGVWDARRHRRHGLGHGRHGM